MLKLVLPYNFCHKIGKKFLKCSLLLNAHVRNPKGRLCGFLDLNTSSHCCLCSREERVCLARFPHTFETSCVPESEGKRKKRKKKIKQPISCILLAYYPHFPSVSHFLPHWLLALSQRFHMKHCAGHCKHNQFSESSSRVAYFLLVLYLRRAFSA